MKQIFMIILAMLFYCQGFANDFYVNPTGSNENGDGSSSNPWRTIKYALAQTVADRGDVIHLSAGTFVESERLYVPSGVDIIGAGKNSSIIKVNYFYDLTTVPRTTSKGKDQGFDPAPEEGVMHLDGQSHVFKSFQLDGQNDQCHGGIIADNLTNCTFENLYIHDFKYTGLWIQNGVNIDIKFNKFINNGFGYTVRCSGDIMLFMGENIKIFKNELIENSGDGAYTMMIMNQKLDAFFGYCDGWPNLGFPPIIRDVEIYENYMEVEEYGAWANYAAPAIVMNMIGSNMLNWDIHHNWINNHISFISKTNQECGGISLETDELTGRIHHNVFEMRKASDLSYEYRYAIEANSPNMEIDHNYFLGGLYPVAQWQAAKPDWWQNHYIHHNVFYDQQTDLPMISYKDFPRDFRFEHNTFVGKKNPTFFEYFRLKEDSKTSTPKIASIRNNIFVSLNDDDQNAAKWKPEHFDNPVVSHNLFYKLFPFGSDQVVVNNSTNPETILQLSGNLPYSSNYDNYESFTEYFKLIQGSPAIDAGVDLGTPFEGNAPDIGAFEFNSPTPVGAVYEAENFTGQSGTAIVSNHTGYTGTGFVDFGGNGTWISWNNVNHGNGEATLTFRYANGSTADRQCEVKVNGVNVGNVTFPPTGAWDSWGTVEKTVNLGTGNNLIRLTANSGNGGPNLDHLAVALANSTIQVGDVIWLKAKANNKYVSSDLNISFKGPLYANKTTVGNSEQFTVEDAGNGWYYLKAKVNNQYVSTRVGLGKILNTIATSAGSKEKVKFEYLSDGYIALKFEATNQYVAAENAGADQLIANRTSIGNWEQFSWGKSSANARIAAALTPEQSQNVERIAIYPNPNSGKFYLNWEGDSKAQVQIFGLTGKLMHDGAYFSGEPISLNIPAGLYLLKARINGLIKESKLLVK